MSEGDLAGLNWDDEARSIDGEGEQDEVILRTTEAIAAPAMVENPSLGFVRAPTDRAAAGTRSRGSCACYLCDCCAASPPAPESQRGNSGIDTTSSVPSAGRNEGGCCWGVCGPSCDDSGDCCGAGCGCSCEGLASCCTAEPDPPSIPGSPDVSATDGEDGGA